MSPNLGHIEIVDAHHHFWELGRFPYLWLAPETPPRRFGDHSAIKRNYLPPDLTEDFGAVRLSGSVHVQANCGAADPVDETVWLQALHEGTGLPSAIVAEADLCNPDAAGEIERHARCPAVRGVRALAAWDTAGRWRFADRPGLLCDQRFRETAGVLAERGLSLDLVVVPEQLPEVCDLAADLPELRIAINHLGQLEPDQPGNEAAWRDGIDALAGQTNVALKISGLWTIDRSWDPERLGPHVLHAVRAFGPQRLMYGSNLPVEKVNIGPAAQLERLGCILSDLPLSDLKAIFAGTARSFYRI